MADIRWDIFKSDKLKRERGISFEEIIQGKLLVIKEHPNRVNQNILLFEHKNYIWVVPYVVNKKEIFLKTLFPSRKYTKMWKNGELK
ncbi:MAG: toxin [Elusimicrobia bacterium]|nr:toxin [Elusimicrobiota bacterium]